MAEDTALGTFTSRGSTLRMESQSLPVNGLVSLAKQVHWGHLTCTSRSDTTMCRLIRMGGSGLERIHILAQPTDFCGDNCAAAAGVGSRGDEFQPVDDFLRALLVGVMHISCP
jgi:hypothetical protein